VLLRGFTDVELHKLLLGLNMPQQGINISFEAATATMAQTQWAARGLQAVILAKGAYAALDDLLRARSHNC
jgi:hypothetical protein